MTVAEAMALDARPKGSKMHNKRTEYNGRMFDSIKEANYAETLDLMRSATDPRERVVSWEAQVPYPIEVNGKKIGKYVADFVVTYAGRTEVIDVKSAFTRKLPVYRLKKKLVEALYGIEIKEET